MTPKILEGHASQPEIQAGSDVFLLDKSHLVDPSPTFGGIYNQAQSKLLPEIQRAKMEANNDYARHTAMDKLDRLVQTQQDHLQHKARAQSDLSNYSKQKRSQQRSIESKSSGPRRQPAQSPFKDEGSFGRISPH